ncbi:MAG: hypothetical protein ACLQNE_44900 [Thermoguttaceae bacterium]
MSKTTNKANTSEVPKTAKEPAAQVSASATEPKTERPKVTLTPLQATVELIKRGHTGSLPRLRELLKGEPAVWQYYGDIRLVKQQPGFRNSRFRDCSIPLHSSSFLTPYRGIPLSIR